MTKSPIYSLKLVILITRYYVRTNRSFDCTDMDDLSKNLPQYIYQNRRIIEMRLGDRIIEEEQHFD